MRAMNSGNSAGRTTAKKPKPLTSGKRFATCIVFIQLRNWAFEAAGFAIMNASTLIRRPSSFCIPAFSVVAICADEVTNASCERWTWLCATTEDPSTEAAAPAVIRSAAALNQIRRGWLISPAFYVPVPGTVNSWWKTLRLRACEPPENSLVVPK